MNKRNKSLIALLLVLCIGLVGLTIAYFSNSDTIENEFKTKNMEQLIQKSLYHQIIGYQVIKLISH